MPRPRRSAARLSRKPKDRCARSTKAGAASCSRAQALIEAGLDFADEGDVVADVGLKADAIVAALRAAIARHLADRSGERLRDGLRVVIAGPPNAGKSSLLNALAKRDVAIVSEEAGTTRDVIEVHLDLGGLPVILIDTAGIREAEGKVEARGYERALARAEDADLVLWLVDATAPHWSPPPDISSGEWRATLDNWCANLRIEQDRSCDRALAGRDRIEVSAKTGAGIELWSRFWPTGRATCCPSGAGSPADHAHAPPGRARGGAGGA